MANDERARGSCNGEHSSRPTFMRGAPPAVAAAPVAAAALGKEQAAAKKNRTRQEIPEMSVFAATIFDRIEAYLETY